MAAAVVRAQVPGPTPRIVRGAGPFMERHPSFRWRSRQCASLSRWVALSIGEPSTMRSCPSGRCGSRLSTCCGASPRRRVMRRQAAGHEPDLFREDLHDDRGRRAGSDRDAGAGRARRFAGVGRLRRHHADGRRSDAADRPGRLARPRRWARTRLARGADVAHLAAVARSDRAAGVHVHHGAVVAGTACGHRHAVAAARCDRARRHALVLHRDDPRLPALHPGMGATTDARQLHADRPPASRRAISCRCRCASRPARSPRASSFTAARRCC